MTKSQATTKASAKVNTKANINNVMGKTGAKTSKKDISSVVLSIRQKMEKLGLTMADLAGAKAPKAKPVTRSNVTASAKTARKAAAPVAKKSAVKAKPLAKEDTNPQVNATGTVRKNKYSPRRKAEPKYMNPETGATWSGRGKTPLWLQGRRKSRFAIASHAN